MAINAGGGGTGRKVYLDFMRIIAAFLVIFNHIEGYYLYQYASGLKEGLYLFIAMVTRINVPVFFMISGALLLGKEESYRTLFGKRIKRFVLVIVIFVFGIAVLCFLSSWYNTGSFPPHFVDFFLRGVLSGKLSGMSAYWYLYAYLGMLFMLPLLRKMVKSISKGDVLLLLILHFLLSSLIPMVNTVLPAFGISGFAISSDFSVPLAVTKVFFYPILGYYLEHFVNVKTLKGKTVWLLALGALAGIGLSSLFTVYQGVTKGFTQDYVQLFDYLVAISAFILIKYLFVVKFPTLSAGKTGGLISKVGSLTFGIYLLDPYFRKFLYSRFLNLLEPLLPTLIVSVSWCLFSMLLGGVCTYCLKQLPVFRKIL